MIELYMAAEQYKEWDNKNMKFILACLLTTFVFATQAFAYPQADFDDCISSSKENPELSNVSDESIEGFCDCALSAIIDKGREEKKSSNKCASKNFKK